jgi:hypothetical protein
MNLLGIMLLLWLMAIPAAVQGVGSLTLLEGSVRVIRGTNVLRGVEGMRLRPGDILESSDAGFAQLEFNGGAVVALGPSSHVYIYRHPGDRIAGGKETAELLLLSGWMKGESGNVGGSYRYETPTLAATTTAGTILVHAFGDGSEIFVESGGATIGDVGGDGMVHAPAPAKAGQFFTRHAGKNMATAGRPNPAFIEAMPKAFRDTLPSRAAHFAGKTFEPKVDHAVSYAEVESYLRMPVSWRRGLAERFGPRLKDAEFRKQVEAHVAEHPEWDKILHPEKDEKAPEDKAEAISKPS